MGKISKKYIGTDQVGSVQLELENALSLRAKNLAGDASVDLLEYSADNQLVVQQDLHVLATKNIISDTALGSAFNIQTSLGADIIIEPGAASGASNGGITYIRGGDSDTGIAGAIYLQTGQDTAGLKSSVQVEAGALVLQNSCPIQMFGGVGQNLIIYESFDYASSYGIKSNNYDLVIYTNAQTAPTTNSKKLSLITGSAVDGNTGAIDIISGNATAGDSGNITIQTGTASATRGVVELDAGSILLNVVSGNPVQMGFEGGNSSSLNFTDSLLGEANRSLGVQFSNAGSVNAFVITGYSAADSAVGPVQLIGAKLYKTADGAATSGAVSLSSSADLSLVLATNAEISSGDITISSGNAQIKGTGADASSGDIIIQTGSKEGAGTRGSITLDAQEVQCSAMLIRDVADPLLAQDAATKAYVDSQIASGTTCNKEVITLDGTDITNQYVDLAEQMVPESLVVGVGQRVNLYESLDYTVSVVSGVTRLTFAGPSATGGAEELVSGDVLYIQGIVDISP